MSQDFQPVLLANTDDEWRTILEWLNERGDDLPLGLEKLRLCLEFTLGRELIRAETKLKRTASYTVEFVAEPKPVGLLERFLWGRVWGRV